MLHKRLIYDGNGGTGDVVTVVEVAAGS